MPEEIKKNQKGKNDSKEQRKKRQPRHQAGPVEKKQEKEPEKQKETTKAPEKPAYQPPGPEFYKGLKRETEEILKITEEENSKYKKKEIQSNWAKYEMPIESYEAMDEQEHLGADYETLIQAPLSVGTHFQFKHEKSWDVTSSPSPYETYFDIDMGDLVIALSTIPFYERNNIDKSVFSESDFQSMDHRATKYKQKYYKDNKYNTPDLDAQNSIINKLCDKKEENTTLSENIEISSEKSNEDNLLGFKDIKLDAIDDHPEDNKIEKALELNIKSNQDITIIKPKEIDQLKTESESLTKPELITDTIQETKEDDPIIDNNLLASPDDETVEEAEIPVSKVTETKPQVTSQIQKDSKNPIIESPEDLEKWLDDFLDG
ncbi:hypothetical protein KGM_202705 [Danaus plexippus plexippus]|uniref:Uncharacterized protein n=1 Tax=Danaus plexippus plexippus TaxID=278856 RepID=A0A212FFB7_DANPL|nr:hypothetical protein KGM_202705 [Danaus plexippus plexippus]